MDLRHHLDMHEREQEKLDLILEHVRELPVIKQDIQIIKDDFKAIKLDARILHSDMRDSGDRLPRLET